MNSNSSNVDSASFRDPSGFVFRGDDGGVYRQVNAVYEVEYRLLMDSGLYSELVQEGLLIPHEEVVPPEGGQARVIKPQQIQFISYPYEWSFSQYRDAALLTLDIQLRSLRHGMVLKDASAYNVVFHKGRPVFIDTLSFARYDEGSPWVAYGQFCSHFLAPLALMSARDVRLQRLMESFIDGIPLDFASRLLPLRARLRPGLFMHIVLHAWMQKRYADTSSGGGGGPAPSARVSSSGLRAMAQGLSSLVESLTWKPAGTEWADYYATSSYDAEATEGKKRMVEEFVKLAAPATVWDLGANTGLFSRLAADVGAETVAFDIDPACVDLCYREVKHRGEPRLLPLRVDLTNPSPALGWANAERKSFMDRGPVDLVMMLALIHHLSIAHNLPFSRVSEFARRLSKWLVIEWVPKSDPQVQRLLRSREDIFEDYSQECFEAEMRRCFDIVESQPVGGDGRALYLMRVKNPKENQGGT